MAVYKTKKLQYRQATFLRSKDSLELLLTAALKKLGLVEEREQAINEAEFRHINGHLKSLDMQFGDFINYETGTNKLLVNLNKKVPTLNVSQIAPPLGKDDKRLNEFLDSILYYGVKDNHVVLLQSQMWQGKQFEQYLNWLLLTAGVMTKNRVELSDRPSAAIRKHAEKEDVKAIHFKAPVMDLAEEIGGNERPAKGKKVEEKIFIPQQKLGADIIRTILGDDEFNRLNLDRAATGNLRVDLKISFDRTTTVDGQASLNRLARIFRHADFEAEDLAIDVPGVGTIRGDQLKLTEAVKVETVNGLVNGNDLFPKMHDWLIDLLKRGLVD